MKFAIIGDIHSNKYALKSVLDDIDKRDVDFILSTGDLVGYLTHPNEVIEMLQRDNVLSIKGNHDLKVAESSSISKDSIDKMTPKEIFKNGSLVYTNLKITNDNRSYLRNLPSQLKLSCNELNILMVHGSPERIDEYLFPDSKEIIELSQRIDEDIIISGHTHIPYHITKNSKHFINPGSVGKPKGNRSEATYMILDITDQVESHMIYVEYQLNYIINDIQNNNMISNDLIENLKKGI